MHAITVRSLDRYKQKITTSKHTIISDEPLPTGDGSGPSPYELLLASLGS